MQQTIFLKLFSLDLTKNWFEFEVLWCHCRLAECAVEQVVEQLIQYSADFRLCEDRQWSPLHAACASGHFEIVALLLKIGSNVNQTTAEHDMTPLYVGQCSILLTILILLIKFIP
jgi:hypothetical protein